MTPVNLPVTRCAGGGRHTDGTLIRGRLPYYCSVMAVAAIARNTYLFKLDLEKFAQETGLEVRVAHYPPYTSKYNPIEHRLFPHLTRACQGVILKSLGLVKELMAKASTRSGLRVSVNILDKVYQTGRRVAADVKERIRVIHDEVLAKWNYRIRPCESEHGRVI